MGIFRWAGNLITRNWKGINDKWYPLSSAVLSTSAGVDISPETALNISDFLACLRVMSETVAKLPANINERTQVDGKEERHKATGHPAYTIFHDQPNAETTAFSYYEVMIVDLVSWGRSYSQIIKNNGGQIVGLWRLNPAKMEVTRDDSNEIIYIYKKPDGTQRFFKQDEILDIIGPLGGRSLISLAAESLGLAGGAAKYGGSFFANDATAGVVLRHPRNLRAVELEALKKQFNEAQRGAENARQTLVLEGGMEIDRMSLPPNDAQFLETRRYTKEEIAGWCLVPPHLVGANEHSTFSNIEHQERAGVTNMALPWIRRIENAVNNKFFLGTNYRLEFNFKTLMRGDSEARAKYYQTMISMGAMNRNEVRALEGMNPQEGEQGKIFTVQMATVNLENVVDADVFNSMPADGNDQGEVGRAAIKCLCKDCEDDGPKQITEDWETREIQYRAIATARLRLREIWRAAIEAMGRRIVSYQVTDIRRRLKKERSAHNIRGMDEFKTWLDNYFKNAVEKTKNAALPTFTAYAEQVGLAAALEISEEVPNLDEFIASYAQAFAEREMGSSNGQLQQMDTIEEVEQRLDEWEEGRPDKIADRERYQMESAVAASVFVTYRHSRTWVTVGKNCPACNKMAGRTATWEEPFMNKLDEVGDPESKQTPIKVFSDLWHTPLHRGCDCYIVAT